MNKLFAPGATPGSDVNPGPEISFGPVSGSDVEIILTWGGVRNTGVHPVNAGMEVIVNATGTQLGAPLPAETVFRIHPDGSVSDSWASDPVFVAQNNYIQILPGQTAAFLIRITTSTDFLLQEQLDRFGSIGKSFAWWEVEFSLRDADTDELAMGDARWKIFDWFRIDTDITGQLEVTTNPAYVVNQV